MESWAVRVYGANSWFVCCTGLRSHELNRKPPGAVDHTTCGVLGWDSVQDIELGVLRQLGLGERAIKHEWQGCTTRAGQLSKQRLVYVSTYT